MTENYYQRQLINAETTRVSPDEDAEKEAWRERLRAALRDPQFRQLPGFPIADDDAILALSDPPFYTACPNPFLEEIIGQWQAEALQRDAVQEYQREPFAADVSEGKNNPIYNAHSYHTKVPHPAIMRYILHYTEPGDIVFDGFCGTGMTGVAAQLCGDANEVRKLGYRVDDDGWIWDGDKRISRLGARRAILNDLSPAATFIAYNYNTPVDAAVFAREARRILREVEAECGWMYETRHTDGQTTGKINYTVWSDIFLCPQCGAEMVFWDVAVDQEHGAVRDAWSCPGCGVLLSKSPKKGSGALRIERVFETRFDRALGEPVRQTKQAPVRINYTVGKKRYEKRPDAEDLALIERIEQDDIPYPFPTQPIMFKGEEWGDTWRSGIHAGLTHVHHFYTRRNLWVLAAIWQRLARKMQWWLTMVVSRNATRLNRFVINKYNPQGRINGPLTGTLYVPSEQVEQNLFLLLDEKRNIGFGTSIQGNCISTGDANRTLLPNHSVNYIFVDPPFGANYMYSELNFFWEAWLGVFTNNAPEAVINQTQRKGLPEYQRLMEACFREFYRVLKPGRWMTVEFHNSQNAVWNSIQEALLRAGFMVADVRTLDKKHGGIKAAYMTSTVKQDLIISAYKPSAAFEQQFELQAGTTEGAWAFIRQHLAQLPIVVRHEALIEPIAERMPFLLFDRMVAFHIQRGFTVPLSAAEFYAGLEQRFVLRDGMFFLPDQTPEYDRARLEAEGVGQLTLLVNDEKSALQWLRRALDPATGGAPQTYAEIQPAFLKQLHQAKHEALPELADMLEESFIQEPNGRWRLPDPRKASDLETLRRKALLREFKTYLEGTGRLRQFRSEAVRVGFADAYHQREWPAILKVAARLPESILQEDPELLMYYDAAALRAE